MREVALVLAPQAEMGKMAFEGSQIIKRLISDYDIKCDLKSGGIFAACNNKQFKDMVQKQKLWAKHNHINTELLNVTDIKQHVGTNRYVGGLLDKSGGHIHPLKLVLGEAVAFEALGGITWRRCGFSYLLIFMANHRTAVN